MMKNCLFAVALVSVALWTGCAKGLGTTPSVTVTDGRQQVFFCSTVCRDKYRTQAG